jgi:hypothetical protein
MSKSRLASLAWIGLAMLCCSFAAHAQSGQPAAQTEAPATATATTATQQAAGPQLPGSVSGTVVDPSGALVVGAQVKLTTGNQAANQTQSQEAVTDSHGQFMFASVAPGLFQLAITAAGFAEQTASGTVQPGEMYVVPPIALAISPNVTQVTVTPATQAEVAEGQIKEQEKQRVLGAIPNFYVSYIPNAVPLDAKQKFELAWKTTIDPITFGLTAAAAGLEQADDQYSGYGQGAEGYGKRYGAAYADMVTSTFIGGAILPSLLKQDPRYFYKGTGSAGSRLLYAISRSVLCRGDNGRRQVNYSYLLGDVASGGISNLYYPAGDRGAGLTFENAAIGIGATAAANVLQEFVVKKLTPNASRASQGGAATP